MTQPTPTWRALASRDRLLEERERRIEVLKRYVQHTEICNYSVLGARPIECTCGLNAVLDLALRADKAGV